MGADPIELEVMPGPFGHQCPLIVAMADDCWSCLFCTRLFIHIKGRSFGSTPTYGDYPRTKTQIVVSYLVDHAGSVSTVDQYGNPSIL